MWFSMIKRNLDDFEAYKKFKTLAKAEKNNKINYLRIDQQGELNSSIFSNFCAREGIKRHLTTSYSNQQNGAVEKEK